MLLLLILQVVRAIIIVFLGLVLMRSIPRFFKLVTPLSGRLNRFQFAWRYGLVAVVMHIFYIFMNDLQNAIIVLPAYWFLRGLLFCGGVLAIPFYVSFLGRRLQDLSIPSLYCLPWVWFLTFAPLYGVVSSTRFTFNLIYILITGLFLFLPGVRGSNLYGPRP